MPIFFPPPDSVLEARRAYAEQALTDPTIAFVALGLQRPEAGDWREMIEEFCANLEDLGVPDRDGPDLAVVVAVEWNCLSTQRLISVDLGRRALAFGRQPESGHSEVSDGLFFDDVGLAARLRDALLPTLVTYKNAGTSAD